MATAIYVQQIFAQMQVNLNNYNEGIADEKQ